MKYFIALLLTVFLFGCDDVEPRWPENPRPIRPDLHVTDAEMLRQHNTRRLTHGVRPLALDSELTQLAQKHALWMAKWGILKHQQLGGTKFRMMGENIAYGQVDETDVVRAWMNSSGHRANILRREFSSAGFGWSRDKNGRFYWCAVFGG